MKVVVGLGNPGREYAATRHNIGFRVVEAFAGLHHIRLRRAGNEALAGRGVVGGGDLWVVEPLTFMNRSGAAVQFLLREAGGSVQALVVVHDDLDLAFGRLRFKRRGGAGGHNGVRSIIDTLGTDDFLRLKVGIGRPAPGIDPVDYVLEPFAGDELPGVSTLVDEACEALRVALTEGLTTAMNRFHAS